MIISIKTYSAKIKLFADAKKKISEVAGSEDADLEAAIKEVQENIENIERSCKFVNQF